MIDERHVKKLMEGDVKLLNKIHHVEDIDPNYVKSVSAIIPLLPKNLQKYLKTNKLKVIYIKSGKIPKEFFLEGHLHGYSDYSAFSINLSIDRSGMLCVKNLINNFLHEIGHFAFIYLIGLTFRDVTIKKLLDKFIKLSNENPSVSLLADKYMKHEYAKKLREDNKQDILGVDIKYHETFAELFRLIFEDKIGDLQSNLLMREFFKNEILCIYN